MKLSGLTWAVVGFCVFLIAVCYAAFQHVLPNLNQKKAYDDWKVLLETEANKQSRAEQRVEDAIEDVQTASDEWQEIVATRTPPADVTAGGINLAANRYQLTVDAFKFRNNVQAAVNNQIKRGGVEVVVGPRVPDPPTEPGEVLPTYFNYPTTPYPVAIFDLGTVTVRGTWSEISQNVRSWATMPNYLAVTDGLQVSGTSPELTATYNVTVVAFIRGKKIAPEILAAAPGGAAPAAPGFGAPPAGGGAPAGFRPPGAPPGMPTGGR